MRRDANSFRRLAVKVFVVGLRIPAGMVDNAVSVIGWRVDSVELQWDTARIDDVVVRPSRDDDRKTSLDRCPRTVENRLPGPFLNAKELIQRMNFLPDFFGLNAMTTSWQLFAVYSTRRNTSFFTAMLSMSLMNPFMMFLLGVRDPVVAHGDFPSELPDRVSDPEA